MNLEQAILHTLSKTKNIEKLKTSSPKTIEQLQQDFDLELTEEASTQELSSIIDNIFKHSVNTQNPRFLNQLFGGSTQEAWLGELITAILNTSMATYEIAPLATMMEKELIHSMNKELGFKEKEGLIVPGGSYANMLGINCARFYSQPEAKNKGLYESPKQVVFVSEDAHYSSGKAMSLLGLGSDQLIKVRVDANRRMCLDDLKIKIKKAQAQNHLPICIISTAGTTVYGAFDPISEINDICLKNNIWHHVDAAWGGLALWSQKKDKLFKGIEKVDSVTLDFHKLMASTLTKGIFISSKPQVLKEANKGGGSQYIFHDEREYDIGTYAIQCGRKVDSLPLWLQWKLQGTKKFRSKVSELFELQNWFVSKLKSQPQRYKMIQDPQFMNICFQVIPEKENTNISEFNKKMRDTLIERGHFMVNFSSDETNGYFFRLVYNHWGVNKDILEELITELDQCELSIS